MVVETVTNDKNPKIAPLTELGSLLKPSQKNIAEISLRQNTRYIMGEGIFNDVQQRTIIEQLLNSSKISLIRTPRNFSLQASQPTVTDAALEILDHFSTVESRAMAIIALCRSRYTAYIFRGSGLVSEKLGVIEKEADKLQSLKVMCRNPRGIDMNGGGHANYERRWAMFARSQGVKASSRE